MSQAAATPPLGFEPYRILTICSNRLENVEFPILINESLTPLLIGKGSTPRVWLSAGVVSGDQQGFFQVVVDNLPRSPQVRVTCDATTTVIYHDDTVVCRVIATGPDEAVITELDLRPAGLNIHGDESALYIGNGRHSGNRMSNSRAYVAIN
ncbi:hypothetical protein LMA00_07615 [Burkholderia ambifaria]|uniref:hypothetical protein n=1 Tax=Burkholderia ambifaria TaxID=152480 RepID=UPI001E3B02CA|nr:hypothetical protein [Burkholderia ambifaria]UEP49605.1 hypothetical protein LMA00_07615 [Burkholderia ambifaria]